MSSPQQTTELARGAAQTVEATGGLGMLGINAKILLAQLVNFLIVLLVLWRWVYRPMVKLLDERSARIEASMKHADEIDAKMAAIEKEQQRLVGQAKTEAAAILESSRQDAERRKKEMIDAAKQEVQSVVAQGKDQLQAQKHQMIHEAKEEIVEIAIQAAQKVLQEQIDEKISHKLSERVIKQLS
ncbi:F0F1 ATP synthase subunit B [Candidatus Uhrbacteria bacterium]|nr:F0F1 ATP synthase subunit B [Candidatus Uhrbacteria bacterium]